MWANHPSLFVPFFLLQVAASLSIQSPLDCYLGVDVGTQGTYVRLKQPVMHLD